MAILDVQTLLDRQAVIHTVLRLGQALDEQDWQAARACLADELETDYSSFRGTPPARLTAESFVALRRSGLTGLRTQHLSLNHLVDVRGKQASCRADFVIHRWPLDPQDRRFFHSYGYYRYALIRSDVDWRICGITQVAIRSQGDASLHGAYREASR
jgi:hypothetical protein